MHVFWFRRDLRLEDNVGLFHALNSGTSVLPIFIYIRNLLSKDLTLIQWSTMIFFIK